MGSLTARSIPITRTRRSSASTRIPNSINLEHRREIDRVFTAAETSDLLVIDCRAALTDLFIDFFDEVNLTEVLRSLGARFDR